VARYDNLFQPIEVGPVVVPNRIVRSAHGALLHGEALIAYHEARARGGVGMSTLEATSVHPGAPSRLPLWSDDVLPFYREIAGRVRPYGMKLFQQMYHPGASAQGTDALGDRHHDRHSRRRRARTPPLNSSETSDGKRL